jgi:uracil-DNA glycosylase|tara:strand:- start:418 stop:1521 length:1104 start_codon:yes stop_codon:yes gene_type:complete
MGEYAVYKRVASRKPQSAEACKIAIVFEYPTNNEMVANTILRGGTGKMFDELCGIAGIELSNCLLTHAIQLKPHLNTAQYFFHKRSEYKRLCKTTEWRSPYALAKEGYLKQEYEQDIQRLHKEIEEVNPNIIIVMGSVSLWAVTGLSKIGKHRGFSLVSSTLPSQYKVLPTYSPVSVVKNYKMRPHVVADLQKAQRESLTKELKHTVREIWIEPTLKDLDVYYKKYISEANHDNPLAFDIETAEGSIVCIGFAPNLSTTIVVPFRDKNKDLLNYWNAADEIAAWKWVKNILENDKIVKVAQNQLYDVSWLRYKQNITVKGIIHDTMHVQHSLQPEQEKSLGFLGSIYTNESAWKTLAKFSKSTKADE